MFDIFQMAFMQRALVIAIFISIVTPLIGNTIVLKRLSSIGDALSHAGLAGVAIGLCFSWSPVVSAIVFSVISALIIEYIRRGFPNYSEMATAIVLSFGVGVAAVFSGFIKNAASFNSFLFGSIEAVSTFELVVVVVLSIASNYILVLLYETFFYIAFDRRKCCPFWCASKEYKPYIHNSYFHSCFYCCKNCRCFGYFIINGYSCSLFYAYF